MICSSFLPAATQMIYDMQLGHLLKGVTFECPPVAKGQPAVVRCVLEGHHYSSTEIDRIFSASKAQGKSLYYVDEPLLAGISPDVIFTQDVCEVCQIDTRCTQQAIDALPKQPQLVALSPNNLQDVFECAITIAKALGHEEAAYLHLAQLQTRLDYILDTLRANRAPLRSVMLMEWMQPVYNCGHWIPYQVAYAGGVDMLSNPAGDSIVTPWEKILKYDPEVLVIAPCGFLVERSKEELNLLTSMPGWNDLKAVKNKEVYIADYDLFTQPSASTLVDGIEVLAHLFHPSIFQTSDRLKPKYSAYFQETVQV
ncbi:iron complex transport system substrate-binding protein [Chitinophaga skermanii]|uniref:Iron complex transport system substrate-binding protein n=1 Tax=Chitinophaga skermanii TaxID=331697 RepID=A0A327R3K5_9BACT|nr:ABC transporter substrate-binding protein [Chitinophaga skermanii]RAJ10542.1 iron complex transport system substrate-binding protein [Chitinophaga skermanii]